MKFAWMGVAVLVVVAGAAVLFAGDDMNKEAAVTTGEQMTKEELEMKKEMEGDKVMDDDKMMKEAEMKKEEMVDTEMKKDEMMKDEMKKDEMMDDKMMKDESSAMMEKGSYELYDAAKLAMAETGDVVLFFKASWCPSCRAVDADIKANMAAIPKGLTILEVDYDKQTELKAKYGVTYQHTFVQVDSKGNQISKWSGSATFSDIVAKVQ